MGKCMEKVKMSPKLPHFEGLLTWGKAKGRNWNHFSPFKKDLISIGLHKVGCSDAAASQGTDLDAVGARRELAEREVQTHPDSTPHPEDGIKRLGEVGTEDV